MLELVHYLHLASGVVWAGGSLIFAFVIEPTLAAMKPDEIRSFHASIGRFAGPAMGISGMTLLVTGILRVILGGAVASPADMLQPYGLYVLAAFVIVLVVTLHGAVHRAATDRLLASGGNVIEGFRALQRTHAIVAGTGILVTIGIMAVLGLGLY